MTLHTLTLVDLSKIIYIPLDYSVLPSTCQPCSNLESSLLVEHFPHRSVNFILLHICSKLYFSEKLSGTSFSLTRGAIYLHPCFIFLSRIKHNLNYILFACLFSSCLSLEIKCKFLEDCVGFFPVPQTARALHDSDIQ